MVQAGAITGTEASAGAAGVAGSDSRLATIETHLDHVRADLDQLKPLPTKIAVLDERVAHLPTKGWITGPLVAPLAMIASLIAFSEKLHVLLR